MIFSPLQKTHLVLQACNAWKTQLKNTLKNEKWRWKWKINEKWFEKWNEKLRKKSIKIVQYGEEGNRLNTILNVAI